MTPQHDFNRTVCACTECKRCCRVQPGPLAPGDFERIAAHLGETKEQAKRHFCASPGALIREGINGPAKRVGTICPKKVRGRCTFLDDAGRCTIHSVAPFGCAYFDVHMGRATAHPRSLWLVRQTMRPEYQALRNELPYATSYKPTDYRP